MRKRKVITSLIMAVTMGTSAVMGNVSVSYGIEQMNSEDYKGNINVDQVKISSIHNPIINEKEEEVIFSYVYLGSYPQSEVTGEALTEEIIKAEYISGEAVVAEDKYRKVTTEKGENHYFKYEPIKWRVINVEDNKVVLRTNKILDYQPYNTGYLTDKRGRWNGTSLQFWLNGYGSYGNGFLQQAFTWEEIQGIEDTQIEDQIQNYNQFITDKVFLLSLLDFYEVPARNYLWITEKSNYADFFSPNHGEQYGAWWIRNPAHTQYIGYVDYMDEKGEFHTRFIGDYSEWVLDDENFQANAKSTEIGVCPAITLDITKTNLWKTEEEIKQEFEKKPMESLKPDVTEEPNYNDLSGDINKDGNITLEDAQLTLKAALKIEPLPESNIIYVDMDKDGEVSLEDAQMVLRKALKIEEL